MCCGGRACGGGRGLSAVTGQINADLEPRRRKPSGVFLSLSAQIQPAV